MSTMQLPTDAIAEHVAGVSFDEQMPVGFDIFCSGFSNNGTKASNEFCACRRVLAHFYLDACYMFYGIFKGLYPVVEQTADTGFVEQVGEVHHR